MTRASFELELLDHVGDPALAEAFPGQHVDAARAEQRPQRHLDRAGIGGRHDADAVVGRHLQHFAGEVDGALQARLAELGAVRAAEGGIFESVERPAGALGAGAGGKERRAGPRGGRRGHVFHPSRWAPLGGEGCPAAGYDENRLTGQGHRAAVGSRRGSQDAARRLHDTEFIGAVAADGIQG